MLRRRRVLQACAASVAARAPAAAASLVATLTDSATDTANASTYTWTGRALGAASSDRLIVVGAFGRDNVAGVPTVSSITVGGVSLSELVATDGDTLASTPTARVALWAGVVPSGTTGDIAVVFSAAQLRAAIAVWSVPGASATPFATASARNSNTLANTINVAQGGAVIAFSGLSTGGVSAPTWTGVTKDADQLGFEANASVSAASASGLSAQTGRTVQIAWISETNDAQCMVAVSLQR